MNCRGCGVELDPSEEQVNTTVDQILEASLKDAQKKGGVCPLCGHSKEVPYSHRKTVLFGLLLACLILGIIVAINIQRSRQTQRAAAAKDAVTRMATNGDVVRLLGKPITIEPGLQGEFKQDETGWKEVRLTIPVRGPNGDAVAHVVGGRGTGPWFFTTFEVDFEKQHEKVDLISGRVVEYDPNGYVDTHTQAAIVPGWQKFVEKACLSSYRPARRLCMGNRGAIVLCRRGRQRRWKPAQRSRSLQSEEKLVDHNAGFDAGGGHTARVSLCGRPPLLLRRGRQW